jgi:Protein of unknown function (DUF3443)
MLPRPGSLRHWLTFVFVYLGLASCGGGDGGGSGGSSSSPSGNATNQIAVVVDAGPAGANVINALYASVTLCVPGTTSCQTVDHLLVDTGASGVRILASVLQPGLLAALPPSIDGASQQPVAECMQFVSGYSWGSVKTADIKLGGETASSARIQLIGDPALPNVPGACSSSGPAWNTVQSLGANGIIGLSTFAQDCGQFCASQVSNGVYYACAGASCSPIAVPIANQVWNPVALFPADNNGIVVSLPSVPSTGANKVNGTLTFGIGTQANNSLGSAIVLTVDSTYGEFNSMVDSISYPDSFIDSGSNGLFYGNGLFADCSFLQGFYCPPVAQAQSGFVEGLNGANLAVNFTVSNPESLLASNPAVAADAELAGPGFGGVDWGLPFFFGRSIYIAIEDRSTPALNGPWVGIK